MIVKKLSVISIFAVVAALFTANPAQANTITRVTLTGTPVIGQVMTATVTGGDPGDLQIAGYVCTVKPTTNPDTNSNCTYTPRSFNLQNTGTVVTATIGPTFQEKYIAVLAGRWGRLDEITTAQLANQMAVSSVIVPKAYQDSAVINSSGGTTATKGLRITYGGGQIQVHRNSSKLQDGELYGSKASPAICNSCLYADAAMYNGVYLVVGNTLVGPTGDMVQQCYGENAVVVTCQMTHVPWNSVTTTGGSATGSGTITSRLTYNGAQGAYVVDLTLTYVANNDFFSYRAVVTPPAQNTQMVKFYQMVDSYLGGSDAGPGFYQGGAQPMVGTEKVLRGKTTLEALRNTGRAWDGYFSGFYACQYGRDGFDYVAGQQVQLCGPYASSMRSGGDLLTGAAAIDPNPDVDNGFAAVWKLGATKTATTLNYDLVFSGNATAFPPAISGLTVNGDSDMGTQLSWEALISGSPQITRTQQWYRCNSPVVAGLTVPAGCVVIPSATGATYTTTADDTGKYVTTFVTATNAHGTAQAIAPRSTATVVRNITFPAPANQFVSATGVNVSASVNGGGSVTFTSSTPTVCTVATTPGTAGVTLLKAGNCTITASSGSAAPITRTFAVQKRSQTITFAALPDVEIAAGRTTLAATATSGLPVSYQTKDSRICTVSGNVVTYVSTGLCEVTAIQNGNDTFDSALPVNQSFTIRKRPTVDNLAVTGANDEGNRLSWTGTTSGFPDPTVSQQWYRCTSAVVAGTAVPSGCTSIGGATDPTYVTGAADVGRYVTVMVTATNAAGTATAIAPRSSKINVKEILFPDPADRFIDATGVTVTASAGGASVQFVSTTPTVCTVAGTTGTAAVTLLKGGTCTVTASSAGLPSVTRSFEVKKLDQDITFPNLAQAEISEGTKSLGATASSSLPVTYTSSDESVCTVSGSTVTFLSAGRCEIVASQVGNDSYNSANPVTRFFDILIKPTIDGLAIEGDSDEGARLTWDATIAGSPDISVTHQWYRCDAPVSAGTIVPSGCVGIVGETGEDYTTGPDDVGKYVTVMVNAANEIGQANSIAPRSSAVVGRDIFFADPEDKFVDVTDMTVTASATGGAPVTFESQTPSVCTVSTDIRTASVTFLKAGECTLKAKSGSIPSVTRTFTVMKVPQEIDFPELTLAALSQGTKELNATSTSGLDVSYRSSDTSVCTVSGTTVTFVALGVCEIVAVQAGDDSYLPAISIAARFDILQNPGITNHALEGEKKIGKTLTYKADFVSDNFTNFTRQWYRCTAAVRATTSVPASCSAIAGETASTYKLKSTDAGKYVTVYITARNPVGRATSIAPTSNKVPLAITPSKAVTKRLTATVYFAVLSPVLDTQAKATLTTLHNKVPAKATKIDVLIHGFVQPDHNTANDQSLSKNRAANVTSFLKGKGLPGEHTVIGLGRASDTGAKARRVEVTITYKVMQ